MSPLSDRPLRRSGMRYKHLFMFSLGIIAALLIGGGFFVYYQYSQTNQSSFALSFAWQGGGQSPHTAQALTPGVNINHLKPGEERWYRYHGEGVSGAEFAWVSLTMRYQSEAILAAEAVNFEVVPQRQLDSPFAVASDNRQNGSLMQQADLTELFWSGKVADEEAYYVRVYNRSPFGLDYTLEADVEPPAFSGAIPASFSARSGSDTADPSADALAAPLNARQLSWLLTSQAVAGMTADDATTWLRDAQAVGWISPQGLPVQRDPFAADPDVLWNLAAQAIAGRDSEAVLAWLTQADSLGWLAVPPATLRDFADQPQPDSPEPVEDSPSRPPTVVEAEPATVIEVEPQPAVPIPYQPVSIYPNNPLDFRFDKANSGRLAPYGEHWYDLSLYEPKNGEMIEDLALTMFTTPSDGFIDSRVNFEIFPASQDHIWRRGTPDDMEQFGLGMWLSRDEDDNTGERLWSGSVVDGDRYFVRVRNESPVTVDYYLYAGDIENAELGNPTLHQME